MKRKIRIITAYLIGIMPSNLLRCLLYRMLFGYKINATRIGWGTVLAVNKAELTNCSIGRKNKFIGPFSVSIDERTNIGSMNNFNCGWWVKGEIFNDSNYALSLKLGKDILITSNHYFDMAGSITIGNKSWIAGTGSQFWTHGVGVVDRDVKIGEGCYIGSAVRFAPGSSIGNNVILGLGSVVTKHFSTDNAMIAGHPAKVLREKYDWKTKTDL